LLPALREINGFDVLDTTDNFVCYKGDEAIGTIRLLRPNPAVARVQKLPLGLPLELQCRIDDMPPRAHVAELGRAAILKAHRGSPAIGKLYKAAYEASRRGGITHWIGFSLTETDLRLDTDIVLAILGRKGRTASKPCLRSTLPEPDHIPCRPFYTEEQRRLAAEGAFETLPLPAIVRFLLGIGLCFVGQPIFEPTFKEYVLPIMLPLDDFARSIFGRRYIGRTALPETDQNAAA
ncbi:GNAT family N-acyltransferase, partial [Methylobacterium haplocladii]